MELANDVGPKEAACPSCGSPHWKSARTIVLEGTTMSGGKLEGSVRDKGMFGGGVRSFLLSDRWFSRDYALKADIHFDTMTALAESIRTLLVAQGELRAFPSRPTPKKTIGIFERVRPVKPTYPELPPLPAAPLAPNDKPWSARYREEEAPWLVMIVFTGFVATLLSALMLDTTTVVPVATFFGAAFLLRIPYGVHRARDGNRRALAEHENCVEEHRRKLAAITARRQSLLESFKKDSAKYEDALRKAEAQANFEAAEAAHFERESAIFEQAWNEVILYRERLWDLTRVCSRCSNVYLRDEATVLKELPHALVQPTDMSVSNSPAQTSQWHDRAPRARS
jgi:hypothetical protein